MAHPKLAAVILAAGKGTRMKSNLAKVLHPLGGEPLVSYPVDLCLSLKADPITLVVGHQAGLVRSAVEDLFPGKVHFRTQEEQKGTGHAVMEGMRDLKSFDGLVLILYGDVPFLTARTVRKLKRPIERRERTLAVVTMNLKDPLGYGRVIRNASGSPIEVVEERDASKEQRKITEVNAGIYCCSASFLRTALKSLGTENAQGEYYLTDIIKLAAADPTGVGAVLIEDPTEVMGANDRVQLADLDKLLRTRINAGLMRSGVSIVDPDTTFISKRARIGRDSIIHPGVHIRGSTRIGKRCLIDVGSIITRSVIQDDVELRPYSVVDEAIIHKGAVVGPFSRLRPGAEILDEAHVGNFVELKKTRLGKGAKANHLAYLGDTKIGAKSNVGAGTITCNYDGFGKYVTTIGERVFIGSNATLVAPVRIGNDAYVAAGSTITENVKKDGLVFGRARQVEKKGQAERIRTEGEKRAREAKKAKQTSGKSRKSEPSKKKANGVADKKKKGSTPGSRSRSSASR